MFWAVIFILHLVGSTAVSIKIEVASRFDSSNQLYQQEAISPLFLGGGGGESGGMLLQKNSKISNPSNVISSMLDKKACFAFKKCGFYSCFAIPATQSTLSSS